MFWRYAKTYCLNKAIRNKRSRWLQAHVLKQNMTDPLALNYMQGGFLGSNHN
jgi:hypothetical protein